MWKLKYQGNLFVAEVTLGPGFYLKGDLPLLFQTPLERRGEKTVPCPPARAVALSDAVVDVFKEED